MRPGIHRLTGELASLIGGDGFRSATPSHQTMDVLHYLLAGLRVVCLEAQALSCVLIDDRQNAEPAIIRQSVTV